MRKNMKKNHFNAIWTGEYPTLCRGEWKLFYYGKDVSWKIPEAKRDGPMKTFDKYFTWGFNENGSEEWSSYQDGLKEEAWIKENKWWLESITCSSEEWRDLYRAFQESDWRPLSCGGCI
jgi:hypothetical protein